MNQQSPDAIAAFLRQQYALWNEGKREEFMALFRQVAHKAFTVQYVGTPVQDGWKAMNAIWNDHGGKIQIEVIELLVNGNEAAVHAVNHHAKADGRTDKSPSIETYRLADGALEVRYFYRVAA